MSDADGPAMSDANGPATPRRGALDPAVAAELPGLRLDWLTVAPRRGRSSPAVARLRALSDRYRGAGVVAMRTRPIPRAYRSFYRQIGLDPDVDRIPSEQAATMRLLQGGFRSAGAVPDACLVAVVETGVPVWALEAAAVDPEPPGLGIGLAGSAASASSGSPLAGSPAPARRGSPLAPDTLVVRDRRGVHAPLFGPPLPDSQPGPSTDQITLYSVGVAGVPAIHIHEALWLASELLGAEPGG